MPKLDPIIAVKDVQASAAWYQAVLECKRAHGGDEFVVLKDSNNEVILCLHKWGAHDHPSMQDDKIMPGNGLILYYKTDRLEEIRSLLEEMDYPLEQDIYTNPNSTKREFSLRDPDGYFITITEYHNYE